MSAHTPGPWTVVDGHYPSFKEVKGPSFAISAVMRATDLNDQDYENRDADLHLIAAAPEMLAACRVAVCHFAAMAEAGMGYADEYEVVSAAITKAQGGAA